MKTIQCDILPQNIRNRIDDFFDRCSERGKYKVKPSEWNECKHISKGEGCKNLLVDNSPPDNTICSLKIATNRDTACDYEGGKMKEEKMFGAILHKPWTKYAGTSDEIVHTWAEDGTTQNFNVPAPLRDSLVKMQNLLSAKYRAAEKAKALAAKLEVELKNMFDSGAPK